MREYGLAPKPAAMRRTLRRGVRQVLKKSANQLVTPTYGISKPFSLVYRSAITLRAALSMNATGQERRKDPVAVYDLNRNPCTFDFATFLLTAEVHFLSQGRSNFDVLVILRSEDANRDVAETAKELHADAEEWRLHNILVPLALMYRACGSIQLVESTVDVSKAVQHRLTFPEGTTGSYRPLWDLGQLFRSVVPGRFLGFRANPSGLEFVRQWCEGVNANLPFVVITLRSRTFDPQRNSSLDLWIKFANWLRSQGIEVVFVPDTEHSFLLDPRLQGFHVFREAAFNLGLRLALYEFAEVSFFNSNGPGMLAFGSTSASSVHYLPILEDSMWSNRRILAARGFPVDRVRHEFMEGSSIFLLQQATLSSLKEEFRRSQARRALGPEVRAQF